MLPSTTEWQKFYAAMKAKSGLDLSLYKANQLQRRIVSMMEAAGYTTLDTFWDYLRQGENLTWFKDRLAINVSELYRNPERWAEIQAKVIPDLLSRSKTLRCWSAGCSYGAEAYTLATILAAHFPGAHSIIGTDIDKAALNQANKGQFNDSDMKAIPRAIRDRYFVKEGEHWLADSKLRSLLRFQEGNLLADRFATGFDLIMCRNVVIYFTDEAKDRLYERFSASLKPGGVLFVGSTERIQNPGELGLASTHPFMYQKQESEVRQWRNAS